MLMYYHQETRQGHNTKANISSDKEAKFKYLGMNINKIKWHSQKQLRHNTGTKWGERMGKKQWITEMQTDMIVL